MARKSKKSYLNKRQSNKQRQTLRRNNIRRYLRTILDERRRRPISELFEIIGKAVTIANKRRMYDEEPEDITQEIIDLLRTNTYNLNEIYADTTLLSELCRYGYYTVIAELMYPEYVVDVNLPANDAPIISLLDDRSNNERVMAFEELTTNNNINMNVRKPETNETPLHLACKNNFPPRVINKIIELGGDPGDFRTTDNLTPLMTALKYQCDSESIQNIIDTDRCNPYHRDNNGKTALIYAVGSPDIALILLEKYPRLLTITDNNNRDVYYYVKKAYNLVENNHELKNKYKRLLKMIKPENMMFLNRRMSNAFQSDVQNYDIMNEYMGENAFNKK